MPNKPFAGGAKFATTPQAASYLGMFTPVAGLQAKGNLRYLVVCAVFFFRAQMPPILSEDLFVDGFSELSRVRARAVLVRGV